MSKIKELRENESNNISLVKIFELISGGKTKYVELFIRLFKNELINRDDLIETLSESLKIQPDKINLNDSELTFLFIIFNSKLIVNEYYVMIFDVFRKFVEYNEMGLIEDKDMQKYKDINYLNILIKEAEERINQKLLEKQIKKLYEDDEWLVLIPLTYEASLKYGANTKWCTASESSSTTYDEYTSKGILIYIIKKRVFKTAAYRKNDEISFWNEADKKIDSISFNFPEHIYNVIRDGLSDFTNVLDNKNQYDIADVDEEDELPAIKTPLKKEITNDKWSEIIDKLNKDFDESYKRLPEIKKSTPNTNNWEEYLKGSFGNSYDIIERSKRIMKRK